MNKKRIPLVNEKPKYKKKAKRSGTSKADHKHQYITVLLHTYWTPPGKKEPKVLQTVTKVCKICGRINSIKPNERALYYDRCEEPVTNGDYTYVKVYEQLNEKGKALSKWYRHTIMENTAYAKAD